MGGARPHAGRSLRMALAQIALDHRRFSAAAPSLRLLVAVLFALLGRCQHFGYDIDRAVRAGENTVAASDALLLAHAHALVIGVEAPGRARLDARGIDAMMAADRRRNGARCNELQPGQSNVAFDIVSMEARRHTRFAADALTGVGYDELPAEHARPRSSARRLRPHGP